MSQSNLSDDKCTKEKSTKNVKNGNISEDTGSGNLAREINGPTGPEPTRFGDWERKGRISDF
jgi:hypothetical protein